MKLDTFSFIRAEALLEDFTDRGKDWLRALGLSEVESVRTGDYELFLLKDPNVLGGYQLALQRDGRDCTSYADQAAPGMPLNCRVNLRLLAETLRRWSTYPEDLYVASFNDEKTEQYSRLLTLLKVPFTRLHQMGHIVLKLNNF